MNVIVNLQLILIHYQHRKVDVVPSDTCFENLDLFSSFLYVATPKTLQLLQTFIRMVLLFTCLCSVGPVCGMASLILHICSFIMNKSPADLCQTDGGKQFAPEGHKPLLCVFSCLSFYPGSLKLLVQKKRLSHSQRTEQGKGERQHSRLAVRRQRHS